MNLHQGPGVLVLDPDHASVETLASKLIRSGIPAVPCSSVKEAHAALQRSGVRPGVLLAEVELDEGTGFELAQELRHEGNASPEIILMSNDPRVSLFECHQAGACYFLRKPVDIDDLHLALHRFGGIGMPTQTAKVDPNAALNRLYGQIRVTKIKQEIPVEVSNLGRGGFFCRTTYGVPAPPVGQVVDFNLKLGMVPDCECQGRGIIRWKYETLVGDTGVGIEFLKVPEWFLQTAQAFADLFRVAPFIPNN
jgi:CheY-like chemotaxis protein